MDLAEHGKAIAALHLILGQKGGLLAELGLAQFGANGRSGLPRCQGIAKAPRAKSGDEIWDTHLFDLFDSGVALYLA